MKLKTIYKYFLVIPLKTVIYLKSEFVEKEWTAADAMGKPILPVFIKSEHIHPLLKSRLGVEYDTFKLNNTIKEIYSVILKKVGKRLIDLKDLKTDF